MRIITLFFCTAFFIINNISYGQDNCRVLDKRFDEVFTGKCKKGLAHGVGTAKGPNLYEGKFKEGVPNGYGEFTSNDGFQYLGSWKEGKYHGEGKYISDEGTFEGTFKNDKPNGKGTFSYSSGDVYAGDWKEGLKHGEGKLMYAQGDSIKDGMWEEDIYIGPKPKNPYVVLRRVGIDRFSAKRMGDGNRVVIKIYQNGVPQRILEEFRISGSSGHRVEFAHSGGFDDIKFPFTCGLGYVVQNKLRTGKNRVSIEFKINQPGDWAVSLHN